jgi:hypothetical protein
MIGGQLTSRQTSSGTGDIATTYMGILLYTVAGLAREYPFQLRSRNDDVL